MTVVLMGMLLCLGLAVLVLGLVAFPRVREGERILTPDGGDTLRDARRRARSIALEARQRTGDARDRAVARAGDVRARVEERRSVRAVRAEAARRTQERPSGPGTPAPAAAPAAAAPTRAPAPARAAARPSARTSSPAPGPVVIDLRDPDSEATKDLIAQRLGWGVPEPGPRHRR